MREPHGQPEVIGAIVAMTCFVGGLTVLASASWAWAVRVEVIHGIIAGAVIGGIVSVWLGINVGGRRSRLDRQLTSNVIGGCSGGVMLVLAAIGALAGVIIRAFA